MNRAKNLLWMGALALAGCAQAAPARPEWRVVVATDANVPALGDRLLLEVLDASGVACSACSRQVGAGDPGAWPISFGVVPPSSGKVRVRARLYRSATTGVGGLPSSPLLLDALVELPAIDAPTDVALVLDMQCFGVGADVAGDRSCDPMSGALAPAPVLAKGVDANALPTPGSWPPFAAVPCSGEPPPGMVCVPGGTFLLGSPTYLPRGASDPVPEHLVEVSPFFLDVDEMTVGRYRGLVVKGVSPPVARGAAADTAMCTWSPSPVDREEYPVSCVTRAQAVEACAKLGKRLPTEAEWELAAGNGERESPFPWIDGSDPCAHAVVGAGRADKGEFAECLSPGAPPGPRAGGAPGDVTLLGVKNLGGNVAEWVADAFAPYDDPTCYPTRSGLVVNPFCKGPTAGGWSARGGDWALPAFVSHAYDRDSGSGGANYLTGFRCAK